MGVLALFDITLLDDLTPEAAAGYERYRAAVPELVARFGGRYLLRAATAELLEGAPSDGPHRFHLIEFPDADAARAFWASPDYRAIQPWREGAVEVRAMLLMPPVPPSGPAPDTATAG